MIPDLTRPPCGLTYAEARRLPATATAAYYAWLADGSPWKFSRPVRAFGDRLRAHGYTVYYEGNDAHLMKDVPEDHTPFSVTGWPVTSPYPYCNATDIMPPSAGQVSKLTGRRLPSLQQLGRQLRADRMNGHPGAAWLKYMNWEPEGQYTGPCYQDSWRPDYARRDSSDRGHIHASGRSDVVGSTAADGYDLVARTEANMTIFGWDLSHYDGPDSRPAVAEGFAFFTHKAGGDANDAELAQWWTYMAPYRGRVLLGAYWVLYPNNPVGRADAFLARLDSQCPGWRDGPFILQADCEIWNSDPSTKPGKADIQAFCDRLVSRMPKLRPIVYAPKWAYGDSLTGLSYPLWASSYVSGSGTASALYPGDGSSRWGAYSGKTPAILQFTSSATIAGQTTCDANAYRGSLAQLTALLAPGWSSAMATLDDDDLKAIEAIVTKWVGDKVPRYDLNGNPITGTTNDFMSVPSALGYLGHDTGVIYRKMLPGLDTKLNALMVYAQSEAGEVPATAQAIADAVVADLQGQSAADMAASLVAILGPERAAALMQALADAVTPPAPAAADGDAGT